MHRCARGHLRVSRGPVAHPRRRRDPPGTGRKKGISPKRGHREPGLAWEDEGGGLNERIMGRKM